MQLSDKSLNELPSELSFNITLPIEISVQCLAYVQWHPNFCIPVPVNPTHLNLISMNCFFFFFWGGWGGVGRQLRLAESTKQNNISQR